MILFVCGYYGKSKNHHGNLLPNITNKIVHIKLKCEGEEGGQGEGRQNSSVIAIHSHSPTSISLFVNNIDLTYLHPQG
jgi:hypothetical protein